MLLQGKENPPEPELEDLHLNDGLLDKSIDSIKARDYTWTPEVKEKAHENYAYWHHLRSLDTLAGSAKTLGISPQGAHKRTYNRYMNKAFEDTQYNYADALNILNLAHDISMADSKIRDAGGLTSHMKELCEYLEVSETGTETLQMLKEVIHNQNLFTEEAMTLTGDYYGLAALLSSYAIQAVGAIEQVKEGKKQFNLVEYEIYSNLKSETQTRFQDFLVGEKDARGYAFGENAPIAQGFVDSFLNPPQLLAREQTLSTSFQQKHLLTIMTWLPKHSTSSMSRNTTQPRTSLLEVSLSPLPDNLWKGINEYRPKHRQGTSVRNGQTRAHERRTRRSDSSRNSNGSLWTPRNRPRRIRCAND